MEPMEGKGKGERGKERKGEKRDREKIWMQSYKREKGKKNGGRAK